jgi:hypothetical protein
VFCVFELGDDGSVLQKNKLEENLNHFYVQILCNICVCCVQASVLRAWGGKPDKVKAAQDELIKRAKVSDIPSALLVMCSVSILHITLTIVLKVRLA